jgi:hypothetical protein
MADLRHSTDGPSPLSEEGYDESLLPDFYREFISETDLEAFAAALSAPDPSPLTDDLTSSSRNSSLFITAQSDWAPVHPTSRLAGKGKRRGGERKKRRGPQRRSRDETREGYLYTLLKWPLLAIVGAWVVGLAVTYLLTRLYISLYGMYCGFLPLVVRIGSFGASMGLTS